MSEETGTKILTDEEKREALREKIAASEARHEERSFAEQAQAMADEALEFVKENPLKTIAAVAVGALIIGALTRPGRELGRKAGGMASVATDAAVAYALGLFDAAGEVAEASGDRLSEAGHTAANRARRWRNLASEESHELADYLTASARHGSNRADRAFKRLRGRLPS
ncbi:hypothetical protein [Qipengyuania sp.]|uniref:hypothetical protein n=1 Tax=Qipengyuania sp. TaxID=2004515 RepID=UPI0035C87821